MARKYPRFLYSDPQNTKSEGPFVIHCLHPRFIARIGNDKIHLLENWSELPDKNLTKHLEDASEWAYLRSPFNDEFFGRNKKK